MAPNFVTIRVWIMRLNFKSISSTKFVMYEYREKLQFPANSISLMEEVRPNQNGRHRVAAVPFPDEPDN